MSELGALQPIFLILCGSLLVPVFILFFLWLTEKLGIPQGKRFILGWSSWVFKKLNIPVNVMDLQQENVNVQSEKKSLYLTLEEIYVDAKVKNFVVEPMQFLIRMKENNFLQQEEFYKLYQMQLENENQKL